MKFLSRLITKFRQIKYCSKFDYKGLARELNQISVEEARERVLAIIKHRDSWDVKPRVPDQEVATIETGPVNQEFFGRFLELNAKFMSLDFAYVGSPDWWPDRKVVLVGHTVEDEYLVCEKFSDEVVISDAFDLDEANPTKLKSLYHAVIYFHRAYGELPPHLR